jgi:hypothetical protein
MERLEGVAGVYGFAEFLQYRLDASGGVSGVSGSHAVAEERLVAGRGEEALLGGPIGAGGITVFHAELRHPVGGLHDHGFGVGDETFGLSAAWSIGITVASFCLRAYRTIASKRARSVVTVRPSW